MGKNFNQLSVLILLLQTVVLIGGLVYAARTLSEGNRVAWRTFLDTRSFELGKKLLEDAALRCVYRYNDLPSIDDACRAKIYDKDNITKLIKYVYIEISALREVKIYYNTEDPGYFELWYQSVAEDLSEDPAGIVSYALYDSYDCKIDNNCAAVIKRETGICIKDRRSEVQNCHENLLVNRQRFLEAQSVSNQPAKRSAKHCPRILGPLCRLGWR